LEADLNGEDVVRGLAIAGGRRGGRELVAAAAAERFEVSVATAIRWIHAFRAAGAKPALARGDDQRSQRIEAYRDVLLDAVIGQADITLAELSDLLRRDHGASFAPSTVWRFLDRHAMTFKENAPRQRARTARRRGQAARLVRRPA
jgi:transposase